VDADWKRWRVDVIGPDELGRILAEVEPAKKE
jgi:hypothetical protein